MPRRSPSIAAGVTVVLSLAVALAVTVTGALSAGAATPARSSPGGMDELEATATYKALQQSFYLPTLSLYRGVPSSSCDPYSCLWPFTNAMAATEYLYGSPFGSGHLTDVVARQLGLVDYANPVEASPGGVAQPPAFQSAVAPPLGPGGATYYDDNGWVGLDLVRAERFTGNPADLLLAQSEFDFAVAGWDTSTSDGCPGGVFWEDVAGSQRNTTANAANAEVGLELYLSNGDASDLSWATRMYQWVVSCLGTSDGLYSDHVNPDGSVNTTIWSYNQGTMIGAGALLYEATGDGAYLNQAERTAAAAVSYFGTGSTLVNQGPAFNAIYFRDLFVLGRLAPNPSYASEAQGYAATMWAQRQPSTGLIDPSLGVNGTAPMVELFSLLAGSAPTP